jgi:hypothetical protein
MLLDLVEVAKSHSGLNLAAAFAKVLEDFGISDKVSKKKNYSVGYSLTGENRSFLSPATMRRIMTP